MTWTVVWPTMDTPPTVAVRINWSAPPWPLIVGRTTKVATPLLLVAAVLALKLVRLKLDRMDTMVPAATGLPAASFTSTETVAGTASDTTPPTEPTGDTETDSVGVSGSSCTANCPWVATPLTVALAVTVSAAVTLGSDTRIETVALPSAPVSADGALSNTRPATAAKATCTLGTGRPEASRTVAARLAAPVEARSVVVG